MSHLIVGVLSFAGGVVCARLFWSKVIALGKDLLSQAGGNLDAAAEKLKKL